MRLRLVLLAWIVPVAAASGFACGGNAGPQNGAGVSSSSSTGGDAGTTASTGGTSSASTGGGGSGGSGCSSAHPQVMTTAFDQLYDGQDILQDGTQDPNAWKQPPPFSCAYDAGTDGG